VLTCHSGWGRTAKTKAERGLTGTTDRVLSDITSMLSTLFPSPVPVFLMGHSMGGAEVLTYASIGPKEMVSKLRGVISSAPLIALHPTTRPWKVTVRAGRLAGKLLPHFQLVNKLDKKWLSHDDEANQRWSEDPLNHDTGTLEGIANMLDRAEQLEEGKLKIKDDAMEGGKSRLWLGHGTDDHINLYDASKKYMDECPVKDKTFKTYEGWYHNLHGELEKGRFHEDVSSWILARLDTAEGAESQAKL